ncbi:hypothetical protein CQW23_22971 [Capsicum baccatum]|uniref:Uncharacterized protein n=1 Tax=Capsicum baccatum TaxID=33114 RepID=A0A2G2W2E1_CAPBA|nr:hypothetical protein CQW23_22971 [Capsicum baccatum]
MMLNFFHDLCDLCCNAADLDDYTIILAGTSRCVESPGLQELHTLLLGAKKMSNCDENVHAVSIQWNGETVDVTRDGDAE